MKEIEIGNEEEYELVPMTPLRRLEERMKGLETQKGGDLREFVLDVMDLVKTNQRLVNDIVRSNAELKAELSKLPSKLDLLASQWEELLKLLRVAASTEVTTPEGVTTKFDKLIELNQKIIESNQAILETMRKPASPGASVAPASASSGVSKYPRIRIRG